MPPDATSELRSLLRALDDCWRDPAEAEPEEIVEMLTERQELLDRLAALDLPHLSPRDAEAVRACLARVQERDAALAEAVERWRDSLVADGADVRRGRRGAEGYRRVARGATSTMDRIA